MTAAPHARRSAWRIVVLTLVVVGSGVLAAGLGVSWLLGPNAPDFAVGDDVVVGVVQLRATNSDDFASEELTVAAGGSVVIELFNDDILPHDVAIETPSGVITAGPAAEPGGSALYTFEAEAIPPGQHRFFCTLHPWMEGVLVAKDGAEQGQ